MHYIDQELRPDAAIQEAVIAGTYNTDFQAPEPNFIARRMQQSADKFSKTWGDLPQIQITKGPVLRTNAEGARVPALRQRLGLGPGTDFDAALAQKISEYRAAHDLPNGSHADDILIDSLNKGHAVYSRIIQANLHRASELPPNLGNRFILVNAANQMLYIYEGDRIIESMKVIVGKPDDQTPMLAGFIRYSIVNPYWNVPPDLVRDRYAPRVIRQGKSYLTTRHFEALNSWETDAKVLDYSAVDWTAVARGDFELRFRQRPGPGNGMGEIKFMFPNRYGVYLHDTPSKALFNKSQRTLSAGCVRVEKPWRLANWLYGSRPAAKGDMPEQKVVLNDEVPVYITYFTTEPTSSGFDFVDDIYGRDT